MTVLPPVEPAAAPHPPEIPWPTDGWPRGEFARPEALARVVDEAFTTATLAETNAVVVVQHGRLLLERYGGERRFFDRPAEPVTDETPLLSWSMAKSVLHAAVGILVDEGRLDPEDRAPVAQWDHPDDPRREIRLADLLAMRDGLDFTEEYVIGQPSDVIEMLFGAGKEDVAGFAADRPLAHRPGAVFNYSSGTSNIVSGIVADLVGRGDGYREFMRRRLFGPLGMTSATPTLDGAGVFVASSYLHATARDFAKFGLLYLRGGQWEGRPLLSPEWVATAQVPLSVDAESGHYYGWHWWITGDEYGTYWANGYEGQSITVAPALDALVLRFGHTDAEHYPDLALWRRRVLDVLAG